MRTELVPASILSRPENARRNVALLAGVACAGAGLAGIFLRFHDGLPMRAVIAATNGMFGAVVVFVALGAKDRLSAVGRALGLATVLGILSTLLPSLMLAAEDSTPFVAYLIAGAFFGSFTGFAYGLVLAVIAGVAWNHVAARTHDGADRAMRAASLWSLGVALATSWVTGGYDAHRHLSEWASAADVAAAEVAVPLGIAGAAITIVCALVCVVTAQRRLHERSRWLSTVAFGPDSEWALRPVTADDDVTAIPRLRAGEMILEHRAGIATYRDRAKVEPVAIL